MPEYLAPGVFVEETSFRAKSIEGVGTSVAAVVGPTRTGPLRGTPEVLTSYAEFERVYGDEADLDYGTPGAPRPQANYTALAARAYFDNGGKQLYVARVFNGDENAATARRASAGTEPAVAFEARFPGAAGNYVLELHWREGENLLQRSAVATPADGQTVFLEADGVPASAKGAGIALADAKFPVRISAVVQRNGDQLQITGAVIEDKDGATTTLTGADNATLVLAQMPAATTSYWRITARAPTGGSLSDGTPAQLRFSRPTDLRPYHGGAHWGDLTLLRGTLNAAGDTFTLRAAFNEGIDTDLALPLASLGAVTGGVTIQLQPLDFDLDVHLGGADGEVVYSVADIGTDRDAPNSLDRRLPAEPVQRADQLSQPVAARLGSGSVADALFGLFETDPIQHPDPLTGPRYLIELRGGRDGSPPQPGQYAGVSDEVAGSSGLAALEEVEDVSIVMTPAAAAADREAHQAVVLEVQKHCRRMRYRVGLVDSRRAMSIAEVQDFRSQFSDDRLALYYPWVVVSARTGRGGTLAVPPSGFMAGIYARTDVERGVHKAPANTPVLGALRFNQEINRFQQELLNPRGINCLRSFPGRGHRVWGARTLAADPEWKYLNVRRYFLFLERSIYKGTQWAVFEPNGEALWANVRSTVEDFLFNEWRLGHLLGASPKAAYFVRCDRSTMTQNDIDNGRLVCEIGVAPLRPAEFVVFRIGQKTADA